jgi:hypothetical protein
MARQSRYRKSNTLGDVSVGVSWWDLEVVITSMAENVERRVLMVLRTKSGKEALEKIKEIIPVGVQVMHGSSTTSIEMCFEDYLKRGKGWWKDLHTVVTAESNGEKRLGLR